MPDELRATVADQLVELVHEADDHLGTGFLATPFLLPVLADTGHVDVAYKLLFQDTPPSWLAMIDKGATTIWENWEGPTPAATRHRLAQPLQQGRGHHVPAPLRRRDPTRRRPPRLRALPRRPDARRRPDVGRGHPRRPPGPGAQRWTIDDGTFTLDVEVPPGTEAEVVLPDGTRHRAGPGSSTYVCAGELSPTCAIPPETEMSSPVTNDEASLAR